jgi:hypothetical protein
LKLAVGPVLFKVFHRKSVDRQQTFEPHFLQRNRYLSKMRNSDKVANGIDKPLAMRIFDAFVGSHGKPFAVSGVVMEQYVDASFSFDGGAQ